MIRIADSFLNKITMYRLTLYYLIGLVVLAFLFSLTGILSYDPFGFLLNGLSAFAACLASNYIFAKLFKAWPNTESVFITALILVLIIPLNFPADTFFILLASVFAMGSKYLLAVKKRHIFNPAAVSVALLSFLSPNFSATWWIGNPAMLPFVFAGGVLLTRKIQREGLVFSFLAFFAVISALSSLFTFGTVSSIFETWTASIFHSPLFFFAFVMLTEPLTSPPNKKNQRYYSYLTAFLYSTPQLRLFNIVFTPEASLCIGNAFSYIISPNYRLLLSLRFKKRPAPNIFVFGFKSDGAFKFRPGQYMEWTLPHKNVDLRGNRRYFTIASSPTEQDLIMAVRFSTPSSSYKNSLAAMSEGQKILASQVAGDFVLPPNLETPLVFIAGGIGIAPFRSMIKFIADKKLKCDIVLLYANKTKDDILFGDIFSQAKTFGVKTLYVLTGSEIPDDWEGLRGYLTDEMLRQEIPDYKNRLFYISGPQLMVDNFKDILKALGIKSSNIKLDFFPGYKT
ncbi:MAG: oxidoreductase [Patescibacteria group bacterium]|nr:oxidoreductase [Patescibacteria group bacterium]